jgi:hypothetical protein
MKTFLLITPPVLVPTQIPVGALMFGASLQGQGVFTRLHDASLDFFHYVLQQNHPALAAKHRRARRAIQYFQEQRHYLPAVHRSHINNLHQFLSAWSAQFPGWQIGLTDATFAPIPPHDPAAFIQHLRNGGSTPFSDYLETQLIPAIVESGLREIGISLTYLSQIYFTLELGLRLSRIGLKPILGGALVNVLEHKFRQSFDFSGMFTPHTAVEPIWRTEQRLDWPLQWPELVLPLAAYFTPTPIIPFPLALGCYWNKCLFCPDAKSVFRQYPTEHLRPFLEAAFSHPKVTEIIFNISDSTIPVSGLKQLLPFFRESNSKFYGFFRFEKYLKNLDFLTELRESGAALFQFGLESGSPEVLKRFQKGIDLADAREILHSAHAQWIKNYVYLLFGLPQETEADRHLTQEFVRENHAVIDFLNVSIFNLPTDCFISKNPDEFEISLTRQEKYQTPLQLYLPFSSRTGPVRDQARRFLQAEFRKDPRIRPILLNTPDRLRIDHAVFF